MLNRSFPDVKNRWRTVILPVLAAILCGCQAPPKSTISVGDQFIPVSAVSVAHSGFAIHPGDTYTWRTELLWVGDDEDSPYRQALTRLAIDKEVDRQLAERGIQRVDSGEADFALVGAVRIGEGTDDPAIRELARLYPSLGNVSLTLETGTLMLALSRPGSPVVMWRGAIQTFISGEFSPEERRERLQAVVRSLLNSLPAPE